VSKHTDNLSPCGSLPPPHPPATGPLARGSRTGFFAKTGLALRVDSFIARKRRREAEEEKVEREKGGSARAGEDDGIRTTDVFSSTSRVSLSLSLGCSDDERNYFACSQQSIGSDRSALPACLSVLSPSPSLFHSVILFPAYYHFIARSKNRAKEQSWKASRPRRTLSRQCIARSADHVGDNSPTFPLDTRLLAFPVNAR